MRVIHLAHENESLFHFNENKTYDQMESDEPEEDQAKRKNVY